MCSNVETNLSWTCLVSGLLNFEHPSVFLFCFAFFEACQHTNSFCFKICMMARSRHMFFPGLRNTRRLHTFLSNCITLRFTLFSESHTIPRHNQQQLPLQRTHTHTHFPNIQVFYPQLISFIYCLSSDSLSLTIHRLFLFHRFGSYIKWYEIIFKVDSMNIDAWV